MSASAAVNRLERLSPVIPSPSPTWPGTRPAPTLKHRLATRRVARHLIDVAGREPHLELAHLRRRTEAPREREAQTSPHTAGTSVRAGEIDCNRAWSEIVATGAPALAPVRAPSPTAGEEPDQDDNCDQPAAAPHRLPPCAASAQGPTLRPSTRALRRCAPGADLANPLTPLWSPANSCRGRRGRARPPASQVKTSASRSATPGSLGSPRPALTSRLLVPYALCAVCRGRGGGGLRRGRATLTPAQAPVGSCSGRERKLAVCAIRRRRVRGYSQDPSAGKPSLGPRVDLPVSPAQ